jgi:hypothetical protein
MFHNFIKKHLLLKLLNLSQHYLASIIRSVDTIYCIPFFGPFLYMRDGGIVDLPRTVSKIALRLFRFSRRQAFRDFHGRRALDLRDLPSQAHRFVDNREVDALRKLLVLVLVLAGHCLESYEKNISLDIAINLDAFSDTVSVLKGCLLKQQEFNAIIEDSGLKFVKELIMRVIHRRTI